ncbi:MAG: efflux RND transporter permease subunit [Terricaulis silvestris]
MTLSDISVRRPVLATVLSLLIIAFGAIAFTTLPLRELPDVDQPIVSVSVSYPGASAQVVETQITRLIEDQLSGIDGIDDINSTSRDGRASINIEFKLSRDLEAATNDVRNAVSRARNQLPVDVDDPIISKSESDASPIIWYSLRSTKMDLVGISDYARRYIIDRLGVIDGVASVTIGGEHRKSLRIWLDANAMAARGMTVQDVENALRAQNVEMPAGYVQGQDRDYGVRVERAFQTPEQFARMPLTTSGGADDAAVVRLGDISRIEMAPEEERSVFRGNGVDQVGIGIVRQSRSNALEVGRGVKAEVARIRQSLPPGTTLELTYDSTIFIDRAINQVGKTLFESTFLVVMVIFLFLGSARAAFIPAAVIPVCLSGAFLVLAICGFSVNLLTLMALVLAIGLVVDDSIVVLENVQRRIDTLGEPPLVAAERGTRQVFFAVVATSAVLVAVFAPLLFVGGYVGRLFIELAVTVAGVIVISAFCALSLSPMMCSKLLKPVKQGTTLNKIVDKVLAGLRASYHASLEAALAFKPMVFVMFAFVLVGGGFIFTRLSSELTPPEDRGVIQAQVQAPEGSGFEYTSRVMAQVQDTMLDYVHRGEAAQIIVVLPGFGDAGTNRFNSGFAMMFLRPWEERHRSGNDVVTELNKRLSQIPGAVVRVSMQNPFQRGAGGGGGASIVLLSSTYSAITPVANRILDRLRSDPRFLRPRMNYEPTSPRVLVNIDRERAASLGLSVQSIARTLEATMGARRINTITDNGQEYYVYMQAERDERSNITDMDNKYVRSDRTGELVPLSTVVSLTTQGDTAERRRMNRQAAVTLQASIASDFPMGDALNVMEGIARQEIGTQPITIDYSGPARQLKQSTGAIVFAFGFALVIVFLVLAAQFESFVHPFVIMLTVPLAIAGGLFGLYLFNNTLNIYSEIGLIILIALAAKNGILIVEFANQLRDEGKSVREAIIEAADLRVRPVLMTSIATVVGALPLVFGHGAGAESRATIGVVIFFGLIVATMLTLFVVPVMYDLLARFTKSPEAAARELEAYKQGEAAAGAAAE